MANFITYILLFYRRSKYAIFSLFIFLLINSQAFAHSVQVAYCVSCNGDLRIFIEHWHGTEDPAGTTMTITLTVNGVPSTQTQPPVSGIVNVPFGSLPGCVTPVTVAASCPGDANSYQDWVIYDYTGLPSGVPLSFTIVSGNTVFTSDGCGMYPLTVNFTIPPAVTAGTNVTECVGQATQPITFANGTTWTNDNPGIGLPASGSGTIPSFVPTQSGVANISFNSPCTVGSFTITVNSGINASFTESTNGAGVCLGSPISFTDTSPSGTGWNWDFGDGNTSTLQHPTHTYAAPGTYTVGLTVTDPATCGGYTTMDVTVHPFPNPSFTITPSCPGTNVVLNNTSTIASGTMNFQWTMTGATPSSSTTTNPVFSYATGGAYTVDLVATSNNNCVASVSQPVTIPYMPVPEFTFTDVCIGTASTFTDMSTVNNGTITQWNWNFGDGTPAGTTQNPTHTYAAAGQYTVTLTPTTNAGCTGPQIQHTVTVYALPTSSFTVANQCLDVAVAPNNTSALASSYSWDFGDGFTSTLQNPSHFYAASGNYTITLTVQSGNGCTDVSTQNVTVYDFPTANFSFTNACLVDPLNFTDLSTTSAGPIANWAWSFGDNTSSAIQNPTHPYSTAGNYNVTLIVTTADGCKDTITQQVSAYPIPVPAFTVSAVCENYSNVFTNTSTISSGVISTYNYNFGDGSSSSTPNPTHLFAAGAGTYSVTLTVTSDQGCVDSVTNNAVVHPLPIVDFTASNFTSCSPLCFDLINNSSVNGGSVSTNQWTLSTGETSSSANPSFCLYNSTQSPINVDVTLLVTSNNGCQTTSTIPNMLTIFPIPIASFVATPQPQSIYDPEVFFTDLSITNITNWNWNFGDPGSANTSTLANPSHQYPYPGTYDVYLQVTNSFGCIDDTLVPVVIDPEFILYVPNTFTPDGDGINDQFIPYIADFSMEPDTWDFTIFNRWGDLIFQTDVPTKGWDGYYRGQLCQQDTYVWKIKVKSAVDGKLVEFYGHVNLLK